MLLGEHEHSLDEKNRLTLPSKLRGAFEEGVVVTRGYEGCLRAYPRAGWDRAAEAMAQLNPLREDTRLAHRWFFGSAAPGELDRQGRMVIPGPLLQAAGITREVTITGMGDHVEIWDRAKWAEQLHEVEGSAEDVAERLAN
jgi:transcriptional regulator MraZ